MNDNHKNWENDKDWPYDYDETDGKEPRIVAPAPLKVTLGLLLGIICLGALLGAIVGLVAYGTIVLFDYFGFTRIM